MGPKRAGWHAPPRSLHNDAKRSRVRPAKQERPRGGRTNHDDSGSARQQVRAKALRDGMIFYTVRYRVAYANGESSPIKFSEVMAGTPDEASEKVKRFEFQRTDAHPIRSVNIRAVEIVDEVKPAAEPTGE